MKTNISAALKEFETKYGAQAAADAARLLWEITKDEAETLEDLRDSLQRLLSFRREAILGATQVQQSSFQELLTRLRQWPSILLLYKSEPAAVMVDPRLLEDLEERVSAILAATYWEANEGEAVSPEELWRVLDEAAPQGRE